MQITIFGPPKSGKTTTFNALTRGHAQTAAYGPGQEKAHLGVAKVPDPRLKELEAIFHPKKVVPAEVTYVDLPLGFKGAGISGEFLNYLSRADALMLVVRGFEDPSIPYPEDARDYQAAIRTMQLELTFADLAILERRVERLKQSAKSAKPQEREGAVRELELLARWQKCLEAEQPLRESAAGGFTEDERRLLQNYQFLTAKPLFLVLNMGEEGLPKAKETEAELQRLFGKPGVKAAVLCSKLEMELAQMEEAEAQEFRRDLGLGEESAADRVIALSYELLGLISFFTYTTASQELHAWTIARGAPAVKAAGRVHSDMERGFIRAEVIAYRDLVKHRSLAEGRKHGVLRLEGKNYTVHDGDFITFLFNV